MLHINNLTIPHKLKLQLRKYKLDLNKSQRTLKNFNSASNILHYDSKDKRRELVKTRRDSVVLSPLISI